MWPFRQQKPSHELGDDVPSVINEWRIRRHWRRLPPAVIERFIANATYVVDDPSAAAVALRWLTFVLELKSFQRRLRQIASAEDWDDELSALSSNLYSFGLQYEKSVISARSDGDYVGALLIVVRAVTSSLVCDRYALSSYTTLARLSLVYFQDRDQAALWCCQYRKAESDLLAADESNLSIHARAVRECLDPEKARQTAEEMRRVLPKHLLDKHLPDFDSAVSVVPNSGVVS